MDITFFLICITSPNKVFLLSPLSFTSGAISLAFTIADDFALMLETGTRNFCVASALPDDFDDGRSFLESITAILS